MTTTLATTTRRDGARAARERRADRRAGTMSARRSSRARATSRASVSAGTRARARTRVSSRGRDEATGKGNERWMERRVFRSTRLLESSQQIVSTDYSVGQRLFRRRLKIGTPSARLFSSRPPPSRRESASVFSRRNLRAERPFPK